MELKNQLLTAIDLAIRAGKAILDLYSKDDLDIAFKPDISPLTQADLASHRLIVNGLCRMTPTLPVLSEESKTISYENRKDWERFWMVDPLDGTKEFIKRNGEFTVNIALIGWGAPLVGVVHAPALGVTYYACRGNGAFRQKIGEAPSRIAVDTCTDRKFRIVASRSHASPMLGQFLKGIGDYECVSMGSSLKFCLVAEGSAYLYPRLGPTMEWDTAAGQCIVEEAGGTVTTLSGTRLRYNKCDLANPDFVVSAGNRYHWQDYIDNSPNLKPEATD